MSSSYCVYKHTSPDGKVYIGTTSKRPEDRWKGGFGYVDNLPLFVDIVAFGWDNFGHEILLSGLDQQEAHDRELELIKLYRSAEPELGYNRLGGGVLDPSYIPPRGQSHDRTARRRVRCVETRQEYPSINAAARAIGSNRSTLRHTINAGWTCYGYHWEFIDD